MCEPMLVSLYDLSAISKWTGIYVSEKYDGWRLMYDSARDEFYTRCGNAIVLPKRLHDQVKTLCNGAIVILDGELWNGYGKFSQLPDTVKEDDIQADTHFKVYDIPSMKSTYTDRYEYLRNMFKSFDLKNVSLVVQTYYKIVNIDDINSMCQATMKKITDVGGEGIVIRNQDGLYEPGQRSKNIMKLKLVETQELVVMAYHTTQYMLDKHCDGTYVSSLICCTEAGNYLKVTFKANDPPKIGSIIRIKHSQTTVKDIPKFPVYMGVIEENTLDANLVKTFDRLKHSEGIDVKLQLNLSNGKNKYSLPEDQIKLLLKNKRFKGLYTLDEAVKRKEANDPIVIDRGYFVLIQSGSNVYKVANAATDHNIYCICPSWIYQKLQPIQRSCKHCKPFETDKHLEIKAELEQKFQNYQKSLDAQANVK